MTRLLLSITRIYMTHVTSALIQLVKRDPKKKSKVIELSYPVSAINYCCYKLHISSQILVHRAYFIKHALCHALWMQLFVCALCVFSITLYLIASHTRKPNNQRHSSSAFFRSCKYVVMFCQYIVYLSRTIFIANIISCM